MKKTILFFLSFLILITGKTQDTSITAQPDSITNSLRAADSLQKKQQDEILKNDLKQNESNLDALVNEMRKREKKEKQQMYLRLGLGIFFFIVLVVGLMRRRKKKAA